MNSGNIHHKFITKNSNSQKQMEKVIGPSRLGGSASASGIASMSRLSNQKPSIPSSSGHMMKAW